MVREFLTWEEMAAIEVNAPDLPGVLVDVGTSRVYPYSEQLAHIVGYVAPPSEADVADDPNLALPGIRVGRAGLEKTRDIELRGTAGAVQLEVNALGRVIRELDRQEGKPGQDLGLTLDTALQQQVLRRLGNESASAVVLDCRNGEVLAMGTNPSFDPSLFNAGVSQAQWAAWAQDKRTPLLNRAIAGVYAPGSTFKMAVAMAALESRSVSPGDVVYCPGYLDIGDARFHCWRQGGHGPLNMRGGLKNSCDVFFYETARRVGIDRIAAMSHRLGLGTELEIDLPGARSGFIPTREWRIGHGHPWNIGDTVVSGIGQGYIQVTPLQLATYAARVATGRKVEPHLTRKLAGAMQPGSQPTDWPSLGVADRSLHVVREGMWAVVNEAGGTAPAARLSDQRWQMAGKTGSSQVRRVSRELREGGTFDSSKLPWQFRPHALFVAYAPYDAPRYAVSVVVEHGNAGAAAAAPVARDIMMDTLQRDPGGRDELPGAQIAQREATP
jgi:penicillin-binding protein 2